MSSLGHYLRQLAPDGLQINLWPTEGGRYQVNVKERGGAGWTCVTDGDPAAALTEALRQKLAGIGSREVVGDGHSEQIDLEEAIAAVPAPAQPADDLTDMIG